MYVYTYEFWKGDITPSIFMLNGKSRMCLVQK